MTLYCYYIQYTGTVPALQAIVVGQHPRNNGRIRPMSLEMLTAARIPRQVREERQYYIPDYLRSRRGESHDDLYSDLYSAADDHAQDLREAEGCLDDALNLARTLRAAFEEAGDSRAMQADTVLKLIEQLLDRANTAIDRHDTQFMNLFMAYFDRDDWPRRSGED